jgi:hypothetical protein
MLGKSLVVIPTRVGLGGGGGTIRFEGRRQSWHCRRAPSPGGRLLEATAWQVAEAGLKEEVEEPHSSGFSVDLSVSLLSGPVLGWARTPRTATYLAVQVWGKEQMTWECWWCPGSW